MSDSQLVQMANDIAAYFDSEPDRELAVRGIEQHLQRFWEPRMRRKIIALASRDDVALDPLAAAAVARLRGSSPGA
ncbi:MAG: formate dehydrogenase subunit delta [Gammaproteobacteria bacterium]